VSTDGAGVISGLAWSTEGSGADEATGTVPSGPLAALQAATMATVARSVAMRRLDVLWFTVGSLLRGSSTVTFVLRRRRRIAIV
jgi:hypothetical protein